MTSFFMEEEERVNRQKLETGRISGVYTENRVHLPRSLQFDDL